MGRPKTTTPKQQIREWIVTEFEYFQPNLVLDLWGGGASARMMSSAGLPVLSVDDGRQGATLEAMEADASAHGYRVGWGKAVDYVGQADAAWLDFCGHWCPEVASTLSACKNMGLVFVTLMPERTPIGSRLTPHEWEVALAALVGDALGRRVGASMRYRRVSGLWAITFVSRKRDKKRSALRSRWHEDPEWREKQRLAMATWRSKTKERQMAYDRARMGSKRS